MVKREDFSGNTTLVVRDERYIDHDPGAGHPESPQRLEAIYEALDQAGFAEDLIRIAPRQASVDELAMVHTLDYIERIRNTANTDFYQLDPDTSTSKGSWLAACLAAGGVFSAMDAIEGGKARNGFALVRPPGHHAEADHAMGFCLFNNVALGARYGQRILGYEKVMIVDWDLHHGNGTQHAFYDDPSVLYFSTHQYPYYPGTGGVEQVGEGAGRGYTVNVPLTPGAGDEDFLSIFHRVLRPVALSYDPDFILVSAGFDIYKDDPLGGMNVSEKGFGDLAAFLLHIASKCCQGKILFCLEGGYNLTGLKNGVLEVLKRCMEPETGVDRDVNIGDSSTLGLIDRVVSVQKSYWPSLLDQ